MAKHTCLLLAAAGVVAGGAILFIANVLHRYIPALIPDRPVFVALGFLFFLAFALLEIPLMLVALRRMKDGSSPHPSKAYCGLAIFYVAFPAVYAGSYLLLGGWSIGVGIIAATGLLRFASLLIIT